MLFSSECEEHQKVVAQEAGMRVERFLISEAGYVYERTIRGRLGSPKPGDKGTRLRGHISSLLEERTNLGEAVRRWWPMCRTKLEEEAKIGD